MKQSRLFTIVIILALLGTMVVGCGGPKSIIPDEDLEAAIRDALGKPAVEEITTAELAELTMLEDYGDVPHRYRRYGELPGIGNLSGLEYCINLTELTLARHRICNLTPLSNLTNLTELNLRQNQISDISPLSNLTSLTVLRLDGNQISDITPLENLTSLTELRLDGNQISDISHLVNLASLTDLSLGGKQISDFTPFPTSPA